jgi:hypothetical protein
MAHALFGRGQPMTPNDYRRGAPPWGEETKSVPHSYQDDEAPPFKDPRPETNKGTDYSTEAPGLIHPSVRESGPRGGMEGTHVEGWRIARHFNTEDPRYVAYHMRHEDGREARVVYDRKADTYHEIRPDQPSAELPRNSALRKLAELQRIANANELSRPEDDVVHMTGDVALRASIYRQSARRLLGSHHKWLDTDPARLDRRQLMRARAHAMLTGRGW